MNYKKSFCLIVIILFSNESYSILERPTCPGDMFNSPEDQLEVFAGEKLISVCSNKGGKESIISLIKSGADVNYQDADGYTALMHASFRGNKDEVETLIANGANLNLRDFSDGITALLFAVDNNQLEIVKLLVESGADLLIKDSLGKSALDLAKTQEIKDIIQKARDNK